MYSSPAAELACPLPVADHSVLKRLVLLLPWAQPPGKIMATLSLASSLALALRSGRSSLAVAGVFGAGKTRSLTFLLAWLALTTHLKIAVVHKENPAGRAITKLLTAFDLEPDHQRYFIRPVSREEAETNTACTAYDLRASDAAPYIPGCHVVVVTTGLVWDQKGQTHSTLNTHMENVDLLISEEALPSRGQFPDNPSFGCCLVIPNRALVE